MSILSLIYYPISVMEKLLLDMTRYSIFRTLTMLDTWTRHIHTYILDTYPRNKNGEGFIITKGWKNQKVSKTDP